MFIVQFIGVGNIIIKILVIIKVKVIFVVVHDFKVLSHPTYLSKERNNQNVIEIKAEYMEIRLWVVREGQNVIN